MSGLFLLAKLFAVPYFNELVKGHTAISSSGTSEGSFLGYGDRVLKLATNLSLVPKFILDGAVFQTPRLPQGQFEDDP